MNSIMGPIFNEKVVEKWSLWVREQQMGPTAVHSTAYFVVNSIWVDEKCTVNRLKSQKQQQKKKKKRDKNANGE